jgi:hypothetical protein
MTDTLARPQTKLAAALLAAGVVSAASIVGVPENSDLPTINVDVANASVITDWLWNFGDAVYGVSTGVAILPYAAFSLPFDATAAIAAAAQNPSLTPNLLSWLVQRYVNPSKDYQYYTYPGDFRFSTVETLARLLPYPLGLNVVDAVNQITDAIGGALSGLPSAGLGESAVDAFLNSDVGRTVKAASYAVNAPVWVLNDTAHYLGYLPGNLEATVESAIRDPSQIPGLVSNLVYGLVSPYGLLGDVLYDVGRPFAAIPGPIGELASNVITAIYNGINGVLSVLPVPISPHPFPSAVQVSAPSATTSAEANSLPEASLAVAGGITLKSTDPVEKKVDTTDSTVPSPQDPAALSTPATTPKDPAAGDIKPVATPAADAPKAATDTSVTNPVTSGNKVNPGDKFDNEAKDETVKDSGAGVSGVSAPTAGASGVGVSSGAGGAGASGAGAPTAGASSAGVSSGAGGAGTSGAGASGAAA